MPTFGIDIRARERTAKRTVQAGSAAEALTHAYVALTLFMAQNPLQTQSIAVTISDPSGVHLAELFLDMKIF